MKKLFLIIVSVVAFAQPGHSQRQLVPSAVGQQVLTAPDASTARAALGITTNPAVVLSPNLSDFSTNSGTLDLRSDILTVSNASNLGGSDSSMFLKTNGNGAGIDFVKNAGLVLNSGTFAGAAAFASSNWAGGSLNARTFNVLLLGDSLAYNKAVDYEAYFRERYGFNGYGFQGRIAATVASGAYSTNDSSWFYTYQVVPASGTVIYDDSSILPVFANKVTVFYFTTNNICTFDIQASTNQGSLYKTLFTISAQAAGPSVLAWTNITLNPTLAKIKIVGGGGSARIAGINYDSTMGRGVVLNVVSGPGLSWTDWTNIPSTTLSNLGYALNAKLIIAEETSDSNIWATAAAPIIKGVMAGAKNAQTLLVTVNPVATNDSANFAQSAAIKNLALANGWACFDQQRLFVSYEYMVTNNLIAINDVHPFAPARWFSISQMFELTGLSGIFKRPGLGWDSPSVYTSQPGSGGLPPGIYNLGTGNSEFAIAGNTNASKELNFYSTVPNSDGTLKKIGGFYLDKTGIYFLADNGATYLRLSSDGTRAVFGTGAPTNTFEIQGAFQKWGLFVRGNSYVGGGTNYPLAVFNSDASGATTVFDQVGNFQVGTNYVAAWPLKPFQPGAYANVSSNGYPFILLSTNGAGGVSATWTQTNRLSW